jgi:2-[(L-alanin-3-ylcarbamoyl)methyl]-2-hydroxybutanedioate decarboxylase
VNARLHSALTGLPRPVSAYVYDLAILRDRINQVKAILPGNAELLYAVKANSHPDLVAEAAHTADGLEVASGGELAAAIAARPRRIVFGGPAKTDDALALAVGGDIPTVINVEGLHELRRIDLLARRHGRVADIALRINRRAATPGGSHQMTGTATPFGIDVAQLPEAVDLARSLTGVRVTGLHLHAVSNNLDAAGHAGFVARSMRFAKDTARRFDLPLETVNVGGGIGVDPSGAQRFDLAEFGKRPRQVETSPGLVFELGRYLAAPVGWYAAEVVDLKRNHGRDFAVLRGGTHHFRLPAAWGYSHPTHVLPVEEWPYPWPRTELRDCRIDVSGELCTPRDVLARGVHVSRIRIGDLLVFPGTGAYGWAISHHDFLSHPHPRFVVLPP